MDARDDRIKYMFQDPAEKIQEKLWEYGMPMTHEDMEYIEHRVFHDWVGTVDLDLPEPGL